jgi:DNA polymerase
MWLCDTIRFSLDATTRGRIKLGFKAGSGMTKSSAMLAIDRVTLLRDTPYGDIDDITPTPVVRTDTRFARGATMAFGRIKSVAGEDLAERGFCYAEHSEPTCDDLCTTTVLSNNGDIYCASASQMFHVPVEKHGVNGHLRQKGKIAELALGYGGAVGALTAMGALEMGLSEDELPDIVKAWRAASPHIVDLWWKVDAAAKDTIAGRDPNWRYDLPHGLSMRYANGLLHVRLPSGRCLRYCRPAVNAEGQIVYQTTNLGHWTQVETYGPKLIENIVQATARDCLRDAMMAVEKRFPGIVMHVHDEMIVEVEREHADECLAHMLEVMSRPIEWAPGLKLKGDGYRTDYYKKD